MKLRTDDRGDVLAWIDGDAGEAAVRTFGIVFAARGDSGWRSVPHGHEFEAHERAFFDAMPFGRCVAYPTHEDEP